MADSVSTLGATVRLEGIQISSLPPGGRGVAPSNPVSSTEKFTDGSGSARPAPNLEAFITDVLTESIPFIDGVAPKSGGQSTWKVKGSSKKYRSSEAPVHIYEKVVAGKDIDKIEGINQLSADRKDETWFCRKSCHRNVAEKGTASWNEFTHSFKEHHAESEDAFTPTVIGARQAMSWNTNGLEINVLGGKWNNITMVVEEMTHKIDPKPLKNRTFPVVQISASLEGAEEFMVVSIPLNDFQKSPYAEYARDKSLVMARYASVERIRVLPSNGDIEWIMATASDAGGVLPQWMQNLAVPGKVAVDVDMFMTWIPTQRAGSTNKSLPSVPVTSNGASAPGAEHEKPMASRPDSSNKELPAAPVQQ